MTSLLLRYLSHGLLPTPVANDDNKSVEAHLQMKANMPGGPRSKITSLSVMARGGLLPTPTAGDSKDARNRTSSRPPDSKHHDGITLTDAVWMGMLPTPTQRDWKSGEASDETLNRNARPLNEVVISQTGSAGQMRLNPLFVAWMMGYPPGWLDVECPRSKRSETLSSRKSPSKSSAP